MSPTAPFLAPERDTAFKDGRPKAGGTTFYTLPGVPIHGTHTWTGGMASNEDHYFPLFVDTPIVVDQLAMEITTSSAGNGRMGLYRGDTDWQPVGGPLADSGDISTNSTGIKTYTPGTPIFLPRGPYLAVYCQSSTATMWATLGSGPGGIVPSSTIQGCSQIYASRTYAAFPTPGTAWTLNRTSGDGLWYAMVLRVSVP